MKLARLLRDLVILADGTIAVGATVCHKWDSVEMEDGSDLPELSADDAMPDTHAAPGKTRRKLPPIVHQTRRK